MQEYSIPYLGDQTEFENALKKYFQLTDASNFFEFETSLLFPEDKMKVFVFIINIMIVLLELLM